MKTILLQTGYFIDNEWLDKYLSLLKNHSSQNSYIEQHHAIPVAIYKYKYNCKSRYEAEKLADADTANFKVSLTFVEHCRAHLYLYNCTKAEVKHSNEVAFRTMVSDQVKLKAEDLTEAELSLLLNWKNTLLANSNWYWSEEQLTFLKQNYGVLSLTDIANKLGKSKKSVGNYINRLGLSDRLWTDEQLDWLKANRKNYSIAECAKLLNKSVSAVRHKCLREHITAVCNWSKEEELKLVEYKDKDYSYAECAKLLDRTVKSVASKLNELKNN